MRAIQCLAAVCLATSLAAPAALADSCARLYKTPYCGTFTYSTGGSNSYTATFSKAGTFQLGTDGNSPGTYTCYGQNFVEVDYAFENSENQTWYGSAPKTGFGKSASGGYLYSFKLVSGACPSSLTRANPRGATQAK